MSRDARERRIASAGASASERPSADRSPPTQSLVTSRLDHRLTQPGDPSAPDPRAGQAGSIQRPAPAAHIRATTAPRRTEILRTPPRALGRQRQRPPRAINCQPSSLATISVDWQAELLDGPIRATAATEGSRRRSVNLSTKAAHPAELPDPLPVGHGGATATHQHLQRSAHCSNRQRRRLRQARNLQIAPPSAGEPYGSLLCQGGRDHQLSGIRSQTAQPTSCR